MVNRGFSGYNTRWNKIVLPRLVPEDMVPEIAAIVIFLGTNDANTEANPQQRVPADEYKQNLIDMIKYLTVSKKSQNCESEIVRFLHIPAPGSS